MSIQPVSIPLSVKTADLPSNGASRADALQKPLLPAAVRALVDQLVKSLPFTKDHSRFAVVALRDLAAELLGGKPDLAKEIAPGASLAAVIKSDPVFAAAALELFRRLELDGQRAVAAYEAIRQNVSPAIVKDASVDVRALMNSFAPSLNAPLSSISGASIGNASSRL